LPVATNRHLRPAQEAITEDDAFLERVLEFASVPTIMMSMIHMTGDDSLLEGPVRPNAAILGEIQGYLGEEDKAAVRAQALQVLRDYRDRGCTLPPLPDGATIRRMMSFMVGQEVPEEYVPMMLEEMNLAGEDSRSFHWHAGVRDSEREQFQVVVIGAGMAGVLAGIRLQEAGIPHVILEKNPGVGGTWYENTYPGARVDTPNYFYCYSFEPNHDWSQYYSRQPELKAYFERCAADYGVDEHVRLNTEVDACEYDEERALWRVSGRGPEGAFTVEANAVISAVGQLNRPLIPDFPGREDFAGPQFHSAAYEHDHDLHDKRVAVIGSGASAFQLVPAIADSVAELTVFQRSPAWMFPNPEYHDVVPDEVKWLLKHVPYYARWYRFLLFWPASDGLLPSLVIDPDWPHQDRSVCELNDLSRETMTAWIESQVEGDPELRDKVVPRYPPFIKRMLQDNGSWLGALQKDHVELVTEGITQIEPDGIRCGSEFHPVDAIVYATGFDNHKWLYPMRISGRGGRVLAEEWGDEPSANLGITVPGYPNFFCIYGPATNLAHAGSLVFTAECQVRYIMGCLQALLESHCRTIEVREDVCEDYTRRLQEWVAQLVWSHEGSGSWYKNSQGHVTSNLPWRLIDYWKWTREPVLDDYRLESS
jgi:4-hydroxyacetophenone monooxygenase